MIQKNDDIRELWIRYKKDRSTELRNEILIYYTGLVKRVVNRMITKYNDYIDGDDLIGYGIFGLIDAIEKFDIDKGVKFETYASFRIRGSIIDQIREQDWVPRSLRTKAKALEESFEELQIKLGRPVEDEELADHMGITVEELNKLMGQIHSFSILSLDDQILEIVKAPDELTNGSKTPEEHTMVGELKSALSKAIDSLLENERKIVSLYYFEELTLKEIGMIIGVSESRVSQLHSRALIKLKNSLKRLEILE